MQKILFGKIKIDQKNNKREKFIENILNFYKETKKNLENLKDLQKLAFDEKDNETLEDCSKKYIQHLKK